MAKISVSPIAQFSYQRDGLGRVQQLDEVVLGVPKQTRYIYDLAGRLTDVSVNGVATSHYEYDLNSNRVKSVLGSTTKLATFDAQDRLKDFASNQYLFNLRGQLFEKTDSTTLAKTKYTYNAFGDLKSVVLPNQTKIDYLIDGEHHRVGRLLNGNLDRYYGFDAEGRVLYERQAGAGGVFRLYIYLPQSHSPEAFFDGSTGVYYKLIKDHLGSIRMVINSNTGIVAQELDYDEWGQVIKDTNPGFQLFGFAGGVYDKDTKLVRFGARDYDAETGRWTAKDPLLFGGGDVNLYGYVANDPVNGIDPSGLAVGDWWDLPANYGRAQEIASEEHANWAGHHNDWGDAMRHFEWSRRTTVETNSFTAFTAGWAHEIEYFFRRGNMSASQYLRESQMDVNNNALGRDAGRNGALMCPSNLTTQPRAGGY